jgi:copper chaperone CopZ
MKKILIEGIQCPHCSAAVEKALRAVAGVQKVTVDLASKQLQWRAENS